MIQDAAKPVGSLLKLKLTTTYVEMQFEQERIEYLEYRERVLINACKVKDAQLKELRRHIDLLLPLRGPTDKAWAWSESDPEMRKLREQVVEQLKDCIKCHGPITEKWLYSAAKRVLRPFIRHFKDKMKANA